MFFKVCLSVCFLLMVVGCATDDGVKKSTNGGISTNNVINKKSETSKQENAIFSKYGESSHSLGSVVNLRVDYSGKYKISEIDRYLMSSYTKRYVYKTFTKGKHTYTMPSYDYLKMTRAGPDWKIDVVEGKDGSFTINGKNSVGLKLDTTCSTLKVCFSLI